MKFFRVDNSICTHCGRCMPACPTGAIYSIEEGLRFIDYSKCNSCGNCMKKCDDRAITLETLESTVRSLEKSTQYRRQIRRLEAELSISSEKNAGMEALLRHILSMLTTGVIIADKSEKILYANPVFVQFAITDPIKKSNMPEDLSGIRLSDAFPEELFGLLRTGLTGQPLDGVVAHVNGRPISMAITTVSELFVIIVDDISSSKIAGDKIAHLIRSAIDRKMAMIQEIGTMLGEEASAEITDLGNALKIIEANSRVQ